MERTTEQYFAYLSTEDSKAPKDHYILKFNKNAHGADDFCSLAESMASELKRISEGKTFISSPTAESLTIVVINEGQTEEQKEEQLKTISDFLWNELVRIAEPRGGVIDTIRKDFSLPKRLKPKEAGVSTQQEGNKEASCWSSMFPKGTQKEGQEESKKSSCLLM